MKAYMVMEVAVRAALTSASHGGEWSASRPGRFTPGKNPGTAGYEIVCFTTHALQ
jgi:hypothetical protein